MTSIPASSSASRTRCSSWWAWRCTPSLARRQRHPSRARRRAEIVSVLVAIDPAGASGAVRPRQR